MSVDEKHRLQGLRDWARGKREVIRKNSHLNRLYRAGVGLVGTIMILAGAVMVPLPTPGFGWIMIFLGLGVLSTEFTWAHWITTKLRRGLDWLGAWWGRRNKAEKLGMIGTLTVLILVVVWMSGMLATIGHWVHLDQAWLRGPFRS